jgi:hypothetical protein
MSDEGWAEQPYLAVLGSCYFPGLVAHMLRAGSRTGPHKTPD